MSQAANIVTRTDQDAPPFGILWPDWDDSVIDFTTGWTSFELELVDYQAIPAIEKAMNTTGTPGCIIGAAVEPNIVIVWPAGWFSDVTPGRYKMHIHAISTDGHDRIFNLDNPPTVEVQLAPV